MSALRHSWILGVVGVLGVVAFGSLWFVTGQVGALAQVCGVLGALSLVAYAFLDRDKFAEGADPREALASASAVLAVVLAVLLGGLLVSLAGTYDQTWDLTRSGQNTLSQRTRGVLDGLDQELTIYGVFRQGMEDRETFERLAGLYAQRSRQVTLQMIDPLTEPTKAGALVKSTGNDELDRLSEQGTVLLSYAGRRRRLESRFDEEAVTNAIVKLVSGEDHRICWSIGHDERDPDDDQSSSGWGGTVVRLEDRNVVVTEQRILTGGVPRACEALLIVGPRRDFVPRELEAVAGYVAEGGQVLVALDSKSPEGAELPYLVEDLARYGVQVGDVILENSADNVTEGPGREPLYVYGPQNMGQHPIVAVSTVVTARWPIAVLPQDVPGISVEALMVSSQLSWAESSFDFDAQQLPQPDPGELTGPVPWAVIAEVRDPSVLQVDRGEVPTDPIEPDGYEGPAIMRQPETLLPDDLTPKPGGRVIVIGDADMGSNPLQNLFATGTVVLNAATWLLDETDQLGQDADASESLLLSDAGKAFTYLLGLILLPGFAGLTGLVLLVRRRFL